MEAADTTTTRSVTELIHSEARWRAILAGMPDPVVTIDPHGTIQSANDSCLTGFGYEPRELIGRNITVLMTEPHRSAHDGYLKRFRETGDLDSLGWSRELPVLRKDGREIECEIAVSRIEVADQDEPLYCGSFRDITTRRRAERALAESERRFHAIFDQEVQFVGLLDPDGTMLEANRASLDAVGATRDEVVGKYFWDTPWWAHSASAREHLIRSVQRAAAGEFVRFETKHRAVDGRLLNIDFSLKPFRDEAGRVVLLLPEGRDITDVKQAQQRELAMMRAFADIGESASLLAHEIKNPITAVNAALRAVAGRLEQDDQEVIVDLVARMQRLESLMRRTLTLARPLEVRSEPCDVTGLLTASVEPLRPELEDVELEISVGVDCPPVLADAALMDDVLTNLLRNALEAVRPAGRIRLKAEPHEDRVLLLVDDDGPGIPENLLATLFKPFVSTKAGGTGLGLAIVRKVVEAHGGTVGVHNSPLGGARFELGLPAVKS
jgi:PAS domain S-box-containing protein